MSLSEIQVIESIAISGQKTNPEPGWQASVFRTIRDEAQPARLRLVTPAPMEVRTANALWRSLILGGLTFAAAVAAFFLVLDQRPDDRITKRTKAIAMVVEFVELETEMAIALAEIDVIEARMDKAFRELEVTLASNERPTLRTYPVIVDTPTSVQSSYRFRDDSEIHHHKDSSKQRNASAATSCGDAGDLSCGI